MIRLHHHFLSYFPRGESFGNRSSASRCGRGGGGGGGVRVTRRRYPQGWNLIITRVARERERAKDPFAVLPRSFHALSSRTSVLHAGALISLQRIKNTSHPFSFLSCRTFFLFFSFFLSPARVQVMFIPGCFQLTLWNSLRFSDEGAGKKGKSRLEKESGVLGRKLCFAKGQLRLIKRRLKFTSTIFSHLYITNKTKQKNGPRAGIIYLLKFNAPNEAEIGNSSKRALSWLLYIRTRHSRVPRGRKVGLNE